MTDNIVDIAKYREAPGNGALEIVREYFEREHPPRNRNGTLCDADYFLAWLWERGFKVVPL